MSMASREQFEQAIKARFGDSIDYRVCKNSDGEYMAWDMQVAWWAWQAASKASEQQLAAVVAENTGLKSKAAELVHEASEVYSAYNATITEPDGDFMDMQTLQEMQCVETPATDAFLAEVRAQAVDAAIEKLLQKFEGTTGHIGVPVMVLESFAAQLRQGAE